MLKQTSASVEKKKRRFIPYDSKLQIRIYPQTQTQTQTHTQTHI